MPRPNISQNEVLDVIKQAGGAWVTFNHISEKAIYSEPTLRLAIKRLSENGIIEANTDSKPYAYRYTEAA